MVWHKVVGTGPKKAVVIHGWFYDHRIFEPLIDCLDRDRYSYAFFDVRGYGNSREVAGVHSIEQMAHDAIALTDMLGWKAFSVIGHSMGGKAAQRLAILAGNRIERVIGITPVPAPSMGLDEAGRNYFASAATDDGVALQLISESLGFRLSDAWMRGLLHKARSCTTSKIFAEYGASFTESDLSVGAGNVTAPMLFLPGEFDQGVRVEILKAVIPGLFPQAKIEVLPNAGHYPMVETPVYLATRIEKFLEAGE